MKRPELEVVVRCRNEMPYAAKTIEALQRQGARCEILFLDCGSTDGSKEAAQRAGLRCVDIDPKRYIPGQVLNLGMALTRSEVVAFVNADAIPLEESALEALLDSLDGPKVAATFGRQVVRTEADKPTKLDYQRAFGDTSPTLRQGRFFSMAASAIRREVWAQLPFDESLRYSEDVDWTHRLSALGWETRYAPNARFEHSHSYNAKESFKRRRGEGEADAKIYRLGRPSVTRELLRPLAGALLRDAVAGCFAPLTRLAQASGYWAGRKQAVSL